jgi:hypothetical protein
MQNSNTPTQRIERKRFHSLPHIGLWIHLSLCAIVIALLCVPQIQTLLHLHEDWSETQAQADIIEEATSTSTKTQDHANDFRNETLLGAAILPEDHVIEFVEAFETAATRTGAVQHVDLQTGERVVQRGVVNIPVEITVSGTWDQLVRYIGELEQVDFYINPTAFSITEDTLVQDQYTLFISAMSFWKQLL